MLNRESEAQTLPYTPDYIIEPGQENAVAEVKPA
jgi:hypothetical protein